MFFGFVKNVNDGIYLMQLSYVERLGYLPYMSSLR